MSLYDPNPVPSSVARNKVRNPGCVPRKSLAVPFTRYRIPAAACIWDFSRARVQHRLKNETRLLGKESMECAYKQAQFLPYLSICLTNYLSIRLSVYLSIHLSMSVYLRPSIHVSVYIYMSVYLSISLPVHITVYLPTYPSIYLAYPSTSTACSGWGSWKFRNSQGISGWIVDPS